MDVAVLSAALVVVLVVLGWALVRLRAQSAADHGKTEYVDRPVEVIKREVEYVDRPVEVIKREVEYVDRPVEVIKRKVEYVERLEPDTLVPGSEHLADPEALPDVPDCVPDSVVDGARLGNLIVRAASTRGETAREGARVRRQTVMLAVLESFDPPVLLSAVAAGRAGGRRSQVGAAQSCRSIQHKLSDAAVAIEAAWRMKADGKEESDQRLAESLRGAVRAVVDPLTEAAKWRGIDPYDIATELTCVLTRLGDGPSRAHLAFCVGAGPVLVLRSGSSAITVLGPDESGKRQSTATLPMEPDAVRWARFETVPGEVVLACTSSTVALLSRDDFSNVTSEWLADPPGLIRFLTHLNFADKICREDRTAVGLWEMTGRR